LKEKKWYYFWRSHYVRYSRNANEITRVWDSMPSLKPGFLQFRRRHS
jgi:hypothetical protein